MSHWEEFGVGAVGVWAVSISLSGGNWVLPYAASRGFRLTVIIWLLSLAMVALTLLALYAALYTC